MDSACHFDCHLRHLRSCRAMDFLVAFPHIHGVNTLHANIFSFFFLCRRNDCSNSAPVTKKDKRTLCCQFFCSINQSDTTNYIDVFVRHLGRHLGANYNQFGFNRFSNECFLKNMII